MARRYGKWALMYAGGPPSTAAPVPLVHRSLRNGAGVRRCANVSNAMKIRVVLRWSVVTPKDVRQSMWNVFKQLPCRFRGHQSAVEVRTGKLALKCTRCGWESRGWNIDRERLGHIGRASQHG